MYFFIGASVVRFSLLPERSGVGGLLGTKLVLPALSQAFHPPLRKDSFFPSCFFFCSFFLFYLTF